MHRTIPFWAGVVLMALPAGVMGLSSAGVLPGWVLGTVFFGAMYLAFLVSSYAEARKPCASLAARRRAQIMGIGPGGTPAARPGLRSSVRRLMAIVALLSLGFAAVRPIVIYLDGTVYAPGYDEARFEQIRLGMPSDEVEALMGPPLRKWPVSYLGGGEFWAYTDQEPDWACYWRRWVLIRGDKVVAIENYYYED